MILAYLETKNFQFLAAGKTESEALATLHRAWETHAKETHASKSYLKANADDIRLLSLQPGQCMRDHELIEDLPAEE